MEESSSTPTASWIPQAVSSLKDKVVAEVAKCHQIIEEYRVEAEAAVKEAEEESRTLRKKVRNLEAEVEKVKREAAVEKVKGEATARLREADAEVFAFRSKALEESRTLNAKVRDLEAGLVGVRVDREVEMFIKRWTGEVVSSNN
jgi:biotin-(acetyl-CoA carboxylase) ligase